MSTNFFELFTDLANINDKGTAGGSPYKLSSPKKYPLNDDNKYLGRLTFEVVDENQYRKDLNVDVLDFWGAALDVGKGFLGGLLGIESLVKGDFKGLTNTDTPRGEPENFDTASDFGKITLYLPQALNIQDAVSYDNNISLGRIGAGVEASLLSGEDAATMANKMGQATAEGIGTVLGGKISSEVASIMAQNRAKKLGFEGSANAVKGTTQIATNPNNRTLFQSVPIRQFSFSFTMIASSSAEADEIEKIIAALRTELYPEIITAGGIDYGYRFPRRFIIKASYNNKEWPGIKFLPCYMQSFQATYNPNGMGFHKDGKWNEVQITMAFSESKALSKNDIKWGY